MSTETTEMFEDSILEPDALEWRASDAWPTADLEADGPRGRYVLGHDKKDPDVVCYAELWRGGTSVDSQIVPDEGVGKMWAEFDAYFPPGTHIVGKDGAVGIVECVRWSGMTDSLSLFATWLRNDDGRPGARSYSVSPHEVRKVALVPTNEDGWAVTEQDVQGLLDYVAMRKDQGFKTMTLDRVTALIVDRLT